MALTLNHLVEKSRTVSIEVHGGSLDVTYNPIKLSAAYMAKMQDSLEEGDLLAMARLVAEVVSAWNLEGPFNEEGDDEYVPAGETVPLEPAYVAWVPGPILQYVISEIATDATPKSPVRR